MINKTDEKYFKFFIKDNQVEILKYKDKNLDYAISIPEEINGMPVTSIGEKAFHQNRKLKLITIPGSVKLIKKWAFFITWLESITLLEGLEHIEDRAFSGCYYLKNINIPNSTRSIGDYAFSDSGFKEIFIPQNVTEIGDDAFYDCKGLVIHCIAKSYAEEFAKAKKIRHITYNDINLTSQDIYQNIVTTEKDFLYLKKNNRVEIKDYKGAGTKVVIPEIIKGDIVNIIAYEAFSNNTYIREVTIPGCIKELYCTFSNCYKLETVILLNGVTQIGVDAFSSCSSLKQIIIPTSVTQIGDNAFSYCSSLNSVTIPTSVTNIGSRAFFKCKDIVIYGAQGSFAEKYAKQEKIKFIKDSDLALDIGNKIISEDSKKRSQETENASILNDLNEVSDALKNLMHDLEKCLDEGINEDDFKLKIVNSSEDSTKKKVRKIKSTGSPSKVKEEINGNQKQDENSNIVKEYSPEMLESLNALRSNFKVKKFNNTVVVSTEVSGIQMTKSSLLIGDLAIGDQVLFEREYDNPRNAYLVLVKNIKGETLGFLPWDIVIYMTPLLDNGLIGLSEGIVSKIIPRSLKLRNAYLEIHLKLTDYHEAMSTKEIKDRKELKYISNFEYKIKNNEVEITSYSGYEKSVKIPKMINNYPVKYIGKIDFYYEIVSITIPDSVFMIGDSAFSNSELRSINLPESLLSIGDSAFSYCEKLKEVKIPKGLKGIGTGAFHNTPWYESLKDKFSIVGDGILIKYTGKDKSVVIPNNVKVIGSYCFRYSHMESIEIPNSVNKIGAFAFSSCYQLEYIQIPDSVKEIGDHAFDDTKWYKNNTERMNIVGDGVLIKYTGSEKEITITSDVKTIGGFVFDQCRNLISIVVPESVTTIGTQAFAICTQLKNVTLPEKMNFIGNSAFYKCSKLETISIPTGISYLAGGLFEQCINLKYVNLPEGLVTIGDGAFYRCKKLESIIIPESVTKIEENAFLDCSNLKCITLPNKEILIERGAFDNCKSLPDYPNTKYGNSNFSNEEVIEDQLDEVSEVEEEDNVSDDAEQDDEDEDCSDNRNQLTKGDIKLELKKTEKFFKKFGKYFEEYEDCDENAEGIVKYFFPGHYDLEDYFEQIIEKDEDADYTDYLLTVRKGGEDRRDYPIAMRGDHSHAIGHIVAKINISDFAKDFSFPDDEDDFFSYLLLPKELV